MKIIGAGLSKTGTTTLCRALEILNLKCLHFDTKRMNDIISGKNNNPDFAIYDDYDAVTDLPSAYFFREFLDAYPDSKAILTIRDIESWWKSISYQWENRYPIKKPGLFYGIAKLLGLKRWPGRKEDLYHIFRVQLRKQVYGSVKAKEYLYKKKFIEHNQYVKSVVSKDRLLIMDIISGDGWEKLCPFLGYDIPSIEFPHAHKS